MGEASTAGGPTRGSIPTSDPVSLLSAPLESAPYGDSTLGVGHRPHSLAEAPPHPLVADNEVQDNEPAASTAASIAEATTPVRATSIDQHALPLPSRSSSVASQAVETVTTPRVEASPVTSSVSGSALQDHQPVGVTSGIAAQPSTNLSTQRSASVTTTSDQDQAYIGIPESEATASVSHVPAASRRSTGDVVAVESQQAEAEAEEVPIVVG